MNSWKNSLFVCVLPGLCLVLLRLSADAVQPLREATFTEVINEVRVADSLEVAAVPAEVEGTFRTPQVLMSGRRSRAQLMAADGTITRVGSNTVFSFSEDSRDIYLKRGSLLFNSPEGKGGGKVVTASAVATVMGTTLIVSATNDGGFKVLVLEGKAQVNYNDGTALQLTAGQMTFVLPGQKPVNVSNLPATMSEAGDPPPAGPDTVGGSDAQPGPVLNFDLQRQQQSSSLVQGFQMQLPSMPKITDAIARQGQEIQQGTLTDTGRQIVGANADGVFVVDPTIAQEASSKAKSVRIAFQILDGLLPEALLFDSPFSFTAGEAPFLHLRNPYRGLVAGQLNLNLDTLDLSRFGGTGTVDIAAEESLNLARSVALTGVATSSLLRISAGALTAAEGGGLREAVPDSGPKAVHQLEVWIQHAVELNGADFYFPRIAKVEVLDGGWTMENSSFRVTGDVLFRTSGDFSVSGSLLSGEHLFVEAPSVKLSQTELSYLGSDVQRIGVTITASELIDLNEVVFPSHSYIRGLEQVSLSARTIVLQKVDFAAGSNVFLRSEVGMLAPDPNTSKPAIPGHVNFIQDVRYGGAPAQDYVAVDKGGTGIGSVKIRVEALP